MKSIICEHYVIFQANGNGIIVHAPVNILKAIDKALQSCKNYITSDIKVNKIFKTSKAIYYFDIFKIDIDEFLEIEDRATYNILHANYMQTTQTV
jgi:NurA-like 5'-3' nuclease